MDHIDRAANLRRGGTDTGGCWRGGSAPSRASVALATCSTARSTASAVRGVTFPTPLTFLTYCMAAARTSSTVAGGSSPLRVVMFRHMRSRYGAPSSPRLASCVSRRLDL